MDNRKMFIHSGISVAIMLLFRFVPPIAQMTPLGMNILGILIGVIYAWCTVDLVWPTIVALVLLGLSGYDTVPAVFQSAASNQVVLLVLTLLLFNGLLGKTGVAKTLAEKLVSAKIASGHPWVLYLLILLASYVVGWITGLVTPVIIWPIVYSIVEELGIKRENKWVNTLIFGIMLAAGLGANLFPFQAGVQGPYGVILSVDPECPLPYLPFMLFGLVLACGVLLLYTAFTKFVFRPDVSALRDYQASGSETKFTWEQKFALILFAAMSCILLFAPLLPKGTAIYGIINGLGNYPVVALAIAVALVVRHDGKPVATIQEMTASLPWGVVAMVAGAMTIGGALTSADTGVVASIVGSLTPMFQGLSTFSFYIITFLVTLIVTNFVNNAVVGFTIVPVIYTIAMGMGTVELAPLMMLLIYMCSPGYLLPSGCVGGSMLHSNTEWIKTKDIMFYSVITIILYALVGALICAPMLNALV